MLIYVKTNSYYFPFESYSIAEYENDNKTIYISIMNEKVQQRNDVP